MIRSILILSCLYLLLACQEESHKSNTSAPKAKSESITGIAEIDDITKQIFEDRENHKLYFSRAQEYMKNKMFENAIYDLNKAIGMDSLVPEYHHLLSDAYMDNLESRKALQVMNDASKTFKDRIPTLLKLSETQLILKQYENSILNATKVLSLNPSEAEGYYMLGMNFRAAGDTDKAINSFQTAIEMNPEIIDAWLILGELYESKNDPIALDYYNGAINANPNSLEAWHSKAFFLQNNNQIDEAIEIYKKMIALDKYYSPSFLNMGILYLEKDSIDSAKEQFNILTKVAPTDFRGHFYLGLCNELLSDFDTARENLRSARNLNPEDARITKAIERVSEKQGN